MGNLIHRQRISTTLPHELAQKLKETSERTGIAQSRIIEISVTHALALHDTELKSELHLKKEKGR